MTEKPTPRKIVIDTSKKKPGVKTIAEIQAMTDAERADYIENVEDYVSILETAIEAVKAAVESPEMQELIKDAEERRAVLTPYIEKILQEPTNRRKFKGLTVDIVLDNMNLIGGIVNPEEVTAEIIKRAEKRKRAADASAKQRESLEKLTPGEKVTYAPGDTIKTTSTKLSNEFFCYAPPTTEIDGQITLNTVYSSKQGKNVAVYSYYNFNEKELTANGITSREFTDFDYFVAMVCNNLFAEGNKQVSLTKLWHEMGNPKSPNPRQLQELRKSLIKGMTTIINISNRDLLEAWNIDTDNYTDIKSPVMPVMLKTEHNRANGHIMNETVYIYAYSPFMLVAEPLNQITTWKKDILKLYPGSRTARYWSIMRYLMREIAWMRNDKNRKPVILFKSLFDAAGAKRTEDRATTLKLASTLLQDVFKACNYISGFKVDNQRERIDLKLVPNLPENAKNQK